MTDYWRGHVQMAFELRTGLQMRDWLLEHGPGMTRQAASDEIGYESPNALGSWVKAHMPEGFAFYRRSPKFSEADTISAIVRHARGESWRRIAIDYGRDIYNLKGVCRRYIATMCRPYEMTK